MKRNLLANLLIAASATIVAPASQQGPSAQTIAAEERANGTDTTAFGGSRDTLAQSGNRAQQSNNPQSIFFGH
ncbi:hypothetical protein BHUM_00074 [Candidatus Burkholderia humilis]|nr:hypothetical protein BHUM_00074 [Candidatus Burkholderia humilis]